MYALCTSEAQRLGAELHSTRAASAILYRTTPDTFSGRSWDAEAVSFYDSIYVGALLHCIRVQLPECCAMSVFVLVRVMTCALSIVTLSSLSCSANIAYASRLL